MGDLRDALAEHLGVPPGEVVTACGSSELLDAAVSAFTTSSRGLVTAAPTFESPSYRAESLGARVTAVPTDAHGRLDLEAMLNACTSAGLVYVCNPNNPTSTVHGASDIRRLVEQVLQRSPGTAVLVDEAYHEYVDSPAYASAIPLAQAHPRVIVTRTFSKIHGMAGLRAGYAVGQPQSLAALRPWLSADGMSVVAAEAARASLADAAHTGEQRRLNAEARRLTLSALSRAGCRAFESHGNFIMADVGRDCRAFASACAARGIRVARAFPPLVHHARITLGTLEEMARANVVFAEVLADRSSPSALLDQDLDPRERFRAC
jgi:histidinol-phosphate aminotransferase